VTFRVDAYPTDTFTGAVQQVRLLPTTVQNVVTYSTVISVPNPQYKLKPGMTANVSIEIARRTNVLRAPAAALRYRPTADVFAALKQEAPPELARGGGRGGPGGRAGFGGARGNDQGNQAPAAAGSSAQRPASGAGEDAPGVRQGGGDRTGDRPAEGRGSGDGRANMTPEERRKRMEERLAGMSPEERERVQQRMAQGSSRSRAGAAPGERQGRQPQTEQTGSAIANTEATTIDALFAPLTVTEGRGRLWLFVNKQLKAVNVRTGISDGTWTEILDNGDDPQLQPGVDVVTNVVTGLEVQPRPGQQNPGSSPLMPQRGNRGGRGR
jgi:multidrug efflux pump subunit AcrA (membrane-fusion protein)